MRGDQGCQPCDALRHGVDPERVPAGKGRDTRHGGKALRNRDGGTKKKKADQGGVTRPKKSTVLGLECQSPCPQALPGKNGNLCGIRGGKDLTGKTRGLGNIKLPEEPWSYGGYVGSLAIKRRG